MTDMLKNLIQSATERCNPEDREWVFYKINEDKLVELIKRYAESRYQDGFDAGYERGYEVAYG